MPVQTTSTIFHKSVQLLGYADDINIMGRTKRATSAVYGELKERAKEVGLIINIEKEKQWFKAGDLEREEYGLLGITRLKWSGYSNT